jgi:enoyl-CoA hydratase/carnithine racemase
MSPAASSAAAAPANEPLLLRHDDHGIITLTLNRPRQYNALSDALLGELKTQLDAIAGDATVRVVVIAGAGQAFCAGHDLKEMRARPDQAYYRDLFQRCSRMMLTITQMPQPVIARVHGIATAAGCQLVATCDLAVAAAEARFATSGIDVGLFCSTPAVALSRNVSEKHAFEMLVTGDFIDADTALRYGLVNRVVPAGELDRAVADLASRIASKSPVAVAAGKRLFYRQRDLDLGAAYDTATETMACNMMAEDVGEGIDAFMQKRRPVWKGH